MPGFQFHNVLMYHFEVACIARMDARASQLCAERTLVRVPGTKWFFSPVLRARFSLLVLLHRVKDY